ncbi:threonine synthase [Marivibrio halodurans]|uniref:Threonine synthase n=1 Tax=Marivibrio halodurans TaxID=2039722 RepID=A0A8J7RZ22_9PROT|nr:threonine synthase [Marivibrio halodurans]MBP5856960.1 threonine synthase [Marivibrio halodurans]
MPGYVSHLECSISGKRYEAGRVHGLSEEGRPLLVRYDLERLKADVTKADIAASTAPGFWRYAPFLPVEDAANRISLGEVMTPLIGVDRWGASVGAAPGAAIVKDEGRLPTGSFKARGLALAVSMAKQFGLDHLAIPTNGNAGAAMAAYARRAGMRATVLCPEDTPDINIREIRQQGAETYRVNGLINECGRIVGGGKESVGWFDLSTLKEPYRIEGKKTMGLELAEQFGWRLPDVIFYPTGGGTGLIGMWKAFQELREIGWIDGPLPRMIAVQAEGCAPIVKAYEAGEEHAPLWDNAATVAAGIRVPVAVGDFLILRAVRESGGRAVAVADADILATLDAIAATDGLLLCPEGAATAAAHARALAEGWVRPEETAILFNCATGLKYPMAPVEQRIDKDAPVDYSRFR